MNKTYKLLPYILIASDSSVFGGWDNSQKKPKKVKVRNSDYKCFTKGCTNKRDGSHLFCSVQCRRLHMSGKCKHHYHLYPQLTQERIREDLQTLDLQRGLLPNAELKATFGYEILFHKNGIFIHS